ncbi:MltR family transcriptional regulator [Flavobacterium lacustre]|uniref:MltR family transcriptional regulator n=1 Tax=Flavobacterium lacustre TaxID=3016339 RepID=UPI0022B68394|nr:MltR family transcriptional regulator [Flavobacterium lacustre]
MENENFDIENSPFQRFPKIMEINRELQKESDRGCCLIASSLLDNELEQLLKCKLIGSKKHKDELFNFNGSIGTFSSKIKLSYSLGLICKEAFRDLEIIRKIRNEFGHSFEVISFDTIKISNEISKLKGQYYKSEIKGSNRQIFTNAFTGIIGQIWLSEVKLSKFVELETNDNYTEKGKEENLKFNEKYINFITKQ